MLDQTSQKAGGTQAARTLPSIAFGIERLGLVAMRTPITSVVILLLLCVGAFFGLERIKIDDSLSQLFRSNTKEFRQYEEVTKRFPATEFDVLVVVEGKSLLARPSLEKLRDLVTDIQLVDGTRGIISLFSARQAPEPGKLPAALFPDKLPEGAAYDKFIETVRTNEILRGKLLSDDGTLALIVLALDPQVVSSNRLGPVVGEIRKLLSDTVKGTDLVGQLSGVPIMQLEIRNAVARDGIIYNVAGVLAGCLIAIVFFRRISFMIIAAFPPILAILLSLGTLGWFGFSLNMFLNVMTPLIMVISFSDSMQLTFAARDRLIAGEDKASAFRNAVLVVGPACVLTHCTAGLSFVALMFSNSDLIRAFGEAGLTATVIALVAVLSLVPLFGILLVRHEEVFAEKIKAADWGVNALRAFCAWIAVRMTARPALWSLIGFLVVAGLTVVYYNHLEPRYRLADQVPDKKQAVEASSRLDAKLTGANPIDVLIEFPKGKNLYADESLQTDRRGACDDREAGGRRQRLVGRDAAPLACGKGRPQRYGHAEGICRSAAGLSDAALHYRAARCRRRLRPRAGSGFRRHPARRRKARCGAERRAQEAPGLRDRGDRAVGDRRAQLADMIGKLNAALTVEFLLVAAFIGLAFRSVVVMLVSILPGIFPVVLSGTVLWLTGEGLQFASVVALIVSFGLGLSATIHFLNRLRLENTPDTTAEAAVEKATILVGPALILTTVVLACGLVVTVFSDLPSLRLFGWLSAFSMVAALVADLFILRPTAMFLIKLAERIRGGHKPAI